MMSERHGTYRCYFPDAPSQKDLRAALLPDPDRLLERGECISSGREGNPRHLAKVAINGRAYLLKLYDCQGSFYRIKNVFRASRALRSLRAGQWLHSVGVSTPEPLACLEERQAGLLGRSYLLCPFLEGVRPLLAVWPELDAEGRWLYLRRLGGIMGRLHRAHIVHGDSNWRNILVGENRPGELRFWLVDLDCTRRYPRLAPARAERDIGHFLRDLSRSGAGAECMQLFRHHWRVALTNNQGDIR